MEGRRDGNVTGWEERRKDERRVGRSGQDSEREKAWRTISENGGDMTEEWRISCWATGEGSES